MVHATVQALASVGLSLLAWYAPHQYPLARVGLVVLAAGVALNAGSLLLAGNALILVAAVIAQRAARRR